jgi:hypothetical protein
MIRRLVPVLGCALLAACVAKPPAAPIVALPPAPPPGEPASFAGMDASALKVAYGAPSFVRKDGTVEMWRYDTPACKAFFFLYPQEGMMAVRHVETVPRGQDIAADPACLAQIHARAVTPVS